MTPWASACTSLSCAATQIQLLLTLSACIQNASITCQSALHVSVNSNSLMQFLPLPTDHFFGELFKAFLTLGTDQMTFCKKKMLLSIIVCSVPFHSAFHSVSLHCFFLLCTPSYVHFSAESLRQSLSMLNWKVILL